MKQDRDAEPQDNEKKINELTEMYKGRGFDEERAGQQAELKVSTNYITEKELKILK